MKSTSCVFDMPVVDVAFQENLDIAETSIIDRQFEDIETLTQKTSTIDEVKIPGEPKESKNNDEFVTEEVEWESKGEDI